MALTGDAGWAEPSWWQKDKAHNLERSCQMQRQSTARQPGGDERTWGAINLQGQATREHRDRPYPLSCPCNDMQREDLGTGCMASLASLILGIFKVEESRNRGLARGKLTMRQVPVCVPANLQVRETFPITRV